MTYSYPLSHEWSTDEIVNVVKFFEGIELAYEKGIKREDLMERYRLFKQVAPSMSEEKTLFREFEKESGYAAYPAMKEAKAAIEAVVIRL